MEKIDFTFENVLQNGKAETRANFQRALVKEPICHISLLVAGNMKKTSNSENRVSFFVRQNINEKNVIAATQVHKKKILFFEDNKTFESTHEADGILTLNKTLVPAVLVADCMPIFVFDTNSKAFGVLHSGWKGTGIVIEALKILKERFASRAEEVYFILGPHIRECCYNVDSDRAKYFRKLDKTSVTISAKKILQFSKWHYWLSLARVNTTLLKNAGVPIENILDMGLCTFCTKCDELYRRGLLPIEQAPTFAFGSNRRENPKGKKSFTQMVAYITF